MNLSLLIICKSIDYPVIFYLYKNRKTRFNISWVHFCLTRNKVQNKKHHYFNQKITWNGDGEGIGVALGNS